MNPSTDQALASYAETIDLFLSGSRDARVQSPSPDAPLEAFRIRLNALLEQAGADSENFHRINVSLADALTDWFATLSEVKAGRIDARVPGGYGDEFLDRLSDQLNDTLSTLKRLREESDRQRQQLIEQQSKIIEELSSPIIQVWDGVLALPVIGIVDSARAQDMMEKLLSKTVESQAQCVIIDLTGVTMIDTKTADYLIKMVKAATLVGTNCVVTGIGPHVAQTITRMGLDLQGIVTLRDLREGLKHAFGVLGVQINTGAR